MRVDLGMTSFVALVVVALTATAATAQSLDEIERKLLSLGDAEAATGPSDVELRHVEAPQKITTSHPVADLSLKHSEMPVDLQELALFTRWYLEGMSESEIARKLRNWREGAGQ